MRNRIISMLLCAVLLLGMIVVAPTEAAAMSDMKCSENAIAVLKKFEDYSKYPYEDNGLYYVGYGCYIPDEQVPYYRENGITEEEADALLREYLNEMGPNLIKFANKNNLYYTQNEFDALMIFTYNVGTNWMWEESDLRTAVINGVRGTDFVYYLTRWCTAGGKVLTGLVNRRLCEADMFLNGNYSNKVPSYYSYVFFDANGGSCTSSIQGYDAAETAKIKVDGTWEGYRFLGWFTAKEGGKRITDLDSTTGKMTLYAHWQKPDSEGVAAEYQRIVKKELNVFSLDGKGTVVGKLKAGEKVTITMDYMDEDGVLWGKTEKGWIELDGTRQALAPATKPAPTSGTVVTVTGDGLRVRKGPGTNYEAINVIGRGSKVVITEVVTDGENQWGHFSGGWISLKYTDYAEVTKPEEDTKPEDTTPGTEPEETKPEAPTPDTKKQTGTVISRTTLNVRKGPGTNHEKVGSLKPGAKVTILETTTVGNAAWGRIDQGWICMQYVQLDQPSADTGNQGTTTPGTTNPGTNPSGTPGTVYNCSKLNIRKGPGTHNQSLGYLMPGDGVMIYEQTVVNGMPWGRMDLGWVCMNYIQLKNGSSNAGSTGNGSTNTGSAGAATGTVTGASALRVRSGPGASYPQVGTLMRGTKVTIMETTVVSGVSWGRIDQGWICLSYVQMESGNLAFSGTITASSLRIRSAAGTSNAIVGTYTKGQTVTILETKTVGGTQWGRTDKGWISMEYVKR